MSNLTLWLLVRGASTILALAFTIWAFIKGYLDIGDLAALYLLSVTINNSCSGIERAIRRRV